MEVVCHNDLSPCNFVFRAGIPIALIDFDTAAPGTRLMDLGYAAWLWLDLGDADIASTSSPEQQRRRLQLFVAAYGDEINVSSIKQAIVHRQELLAAEGEYAGRTEMAQWARHCRIGHCRTCSACGGVQAAQVEFWPVMPPGRRPTS